jgi:selenocysteine-specific elongation factor
MHSRFAAGRPANSSMKHVIVGTAGHIDHGKSSLVQALTGTHPDRLEEEKRRGITIDLGFAFLELEGVRLGFVDVPGHERFVRNMLAGAWGMDLVLMVVAADESIKPQTREHFDICRLLGVPSGLVVITKADLVDADVVGLVRLEIEELVRGSFLDGASIVEVSARTGAGIEHLKEVMRRLALDTPGKDDTRYLRLPIDRAFAVKGFGTVVTGTMLSGVVQAEDEVELFPAGRRLRVRGVQSEGKAVKRAVAGQRTAVNLAGIEAGELARGMALAAPGRFRGTRQLDAKVTLLPSARPLKQRARVHFHHGTADAATQVYPLDGETLVAGVPGIAHLRLDQPVLVLPGDRFILRQFSPVVTIGGGVVLDNRAARHRRGNTRFLPLLEAFESGSREEVFEQMAIAKPSGLEVAEIVARTGWLETEIRAAAAALAAEDLLHIASEQPLVVAPAAAMTEYARNLRTAVEAFHKANPLLPGISKEELRNRAAPRVHPEVFRAVLEREVASRSLTLQGDVVCLPGREIVLSADELEAKKRISEEFERAGLAAPRVVELLGRLPVEEARARRLLQILLREKILVKITEELILHGSALARLRELLAGFRKEHGEQLNIAAFKELTGVSRKYAIPFLEFLDRTGLTRRVGDARVIL